MSTAVKHAARREPWHTRLPWSRKAGPASPAAPLGAPVAPELEHDRQPGTGWTGASEPGQMAAPPWDQDGPDLAELTLVDKPLAVLRPEIAPERAEPGPDLAAAPPDRPYVPQDGGLPTAWLRAIPQSGPGSRVLETLTGMPFFAGIRHDPGGGRIGGLCWGAADDIWLVADIKSVEVADAALAALRELREHLAYGAFRAPAVRPDPDAAAHVETLERELDAYDATREAVLEQAADEAGEGIEAARSVLRAAGNLGFLSAALKRRNGEGCMDLFVTRAALHHAIERGDGAAAGEASSALVDAISELCGDEVACSVANGIVPSGEAVARAGEAPEPEAADEPGEVTDEAAADAGEGAAA